MGFNCYKAYNMCTYVNGKLNNSCFSSCFFNDSSFSITFLDIIICSSFESEWITTMNNFINLLNLKKLLQKYKNKSHTVIKISKTFIGTVCCSTSCDNVIFIEWKPVLARFSKIWGFIIITDYYIMRWFRSEKVYACIVFKIGGQILKSRRCA